MDMISKNGQRSEREDAAGETPQCISFPFGRQFLNEMKRISWLDSVEVEASRSKLLCRFLNFDPVFQ